MKILLLILALCTVAVAADYQQGKLLNVQPYDAPNNSVLGRWARADGGSAVIPNSRRVVALTVQVDDVAYMANFMVSKHLQPGDLVIGDPIDVRIDKDKMFVKGNDKKEVRGYIVRRERVPTSSPQK